VDQFVSRQGCKHTVRQAVQDGSVLFPVPTSLEDVLLDPAL